jgi:Zn-dependent peptidase ImmA (M78 family)
MEVELESVAADLRTRADQHEPAFSTRAIVTACFPDTVVTGRELPRGMHELVTLTESGPMIVYQRRLSAPEQRFAIAHALGHLMFDFDQRGPRCALNDPAVEARADAFAAELLVPLARLEEYVGRHPQDIESSIDQELYLDQVDEIASHFNVPASVIHRQIARLRR